MTNPIVLIKKTIKLNPIKVPNFVSEVRTEPDSVTVTHAVQSLDLDAIDSLATRWLEDFYENAGQRSNWKRQTTR